MVARVRNWQQERSSRDEAAWLHVGGQVLLEASQSGPVRRS